MKKSKNVRQRRRQQQLKQQQSTSKSTPTKVLPRHCLHTHSLALLTNDWNGCSRFCVQLTPQHLARTHDVCSAWGAAAAAADAVVAFSHREEQDGRTKRGTNRERESERDKGKSGDTNTRQRRRRRRLMQNIALTHSSLTHAYTRGSSSSTCKSTCMHAYYGYAQVTLTEREELASRH